MFAKWSLDLFQGLHAGSVRQRFRNLLLTLGLIALIASAWAMREPHKRFFQRSESPGSGAAKAIPGPDLPPALPAKADPNDGRYRTLAEFVAKRYRVSQEATLDWVTLAHAAGRQLGLDPLLIIAVIAVESRFNPIAESGAGAKGLMQVIPGLHAEKLKQFGGEHLVFDPETNILVGSAILKEYLRRTGNLSIALQMYAGALNDAQDTYTVKVLNEKQRLQRALSQPRSAAARLAQASRSAQ